MRHQSLCYVSSLAHSLRVLFLIVGQFFNFYFLTIHLTIFRRAIISDIWKAETRGKGLAIMSVTPFVGPALGPAVAGFMGEKADWRWIFWLLSIFVSFSFFFWKYSSCLSYTKSGFCWVVVLLTIPETYA